MDDPCDEWNEWDLMRWQVRRFWFDDPAPMRGGKTGIAYVDDYYTLVNGDSIAIGERIDCYISDDRGQYHVIGGSVGKMTIGKPIKETFTTKGDFRATSHPKRWSKRHG